VISRSILDIVQIFPRYNIINSNIEIKKCEYVFPMPEGMSGRPYGSPAYAGNILTIPEAFLGSPG
jgi:hypothetical protein